MKPLVIQILKKYQTAVKRSLRNSNYYTKVDHCTKYDTVVKDSIQTLLNLSLFLMVKPNLVTQTSFI